MRIQDIREVKQKTEKNNPSFNKPGVLPNDEFKQKQNTFHHNPRILLPDDLNLLSIGNVGKIPERCNYRKQGMLKVK